MLTNEKKVQQNLNLSEFVVLRLKSIAQERGTSASQVADEFLKIQLQAVQRETINLSRAEVITDRLPASLVNLPENHPIFGKRPPTQVLARRRAVHRMS